MSLLDLINGQQQPAAAAAPATEVNWDAIDYATKLADQAAQRAYQSEQLRLTSEYQNGMLANDRDKLAFTKAQAEWQRVFDESKQAFEQQMGTTDRSGYMPTNVPSLDSWYQPMVAGRAKSWEAGNVWSEQEWANQFSQMTGLSPEIGAQLRAKAMAYGQANGVSATPEMQQQWLTQLVGQSGQQTPTLQRQQMEGNLTGYYGNTPTLARDSMQNQTSLGYLNLLGSLRGPADYFQYLKVLNGTPQGMRDLVGAASGQYALPGYGGGAPGAVGQPVSLQSVLGQVAGAGGQTALQYSANGTAQAPVVNAQPVYQQEGQASIQPYNPAPTGQTDIQRYTQSPMAVPAGQVAAVGNIYQPPAVQTALTAPSQWNAANMARMTPTQKALLYGYYENQEGWRPEDAQALFQQSLPQYQGPQSARISF